MSVVVYVVAWVCKKVHFYCIFLQKYLHISKKSSTFAAGFGIVQAITNNYQQIMNKEEICKVTIEDGIYKVNAMVDNEKNVHFYRVMKGRNIVKGGSFFNDKRAAVMFMLRIAFTDVAQLPLEGIL